MWKVHSCSLEIKGQKRLMWVWLRSFWPMSYHLECLLSEWIFWCIQWFWTIGTALFAHQEKRKGLSRIIWSEDSVALESKSKRKIKYRRQKLKSFLTRRLQLCCKNSVNINDDNKPAQGRVINGLENCISVTIQLLKSAILGTSVYSE